MFCSSVLWSIFAKCILPLNFLLFHETSFFKITWPTFLFSKSDNFKFFCTITVIKRLLKACLLSQHFISQLAFLHQRPVFPACPKPSHVPSHYTWLLAEECHMMNRMRCLGTHLPRGEHLGAHMHLTVASARLEAVSDHRVKRIVL